MTRENFFEYAYSLKNESETREMYDRWSEVYDQDLTDSDYQQPSRCAQTLKSHCPNESCKILDVGCGTGLSGLALKDAGYTKIDGCDLSNGMLGKAEKLGIYHRLFSCNLNKPPIDAKAGMYDAVTAVGVFSFGHIMPEAVNELLRITKEDGIIIIGLNDHFYNEGSLTKKLSELEKHKEITILSREHGDHIPGNNLSGWVLALAKT